MNKTFYNCAFIIDAGLGIRYTDVPSIGDIKDGFWIDGDYEYTNKSDNVLWVPPAALLWVKKEEREVL